MQPSPSFEALSRQQIQEQPLDVPLSHRHILEQREDMRLAHRSVKIVRGLCREYGVSFSMPDSSTFNSTRRRSRKSDHNSSRPPSSTLSTSSSSSDFDTKQSGLESHAKWPDVEELLGDLQTSKRVRALKDISKALTESAQRAERSLEEFDAKGAGSSVGEGAEGVVSEDLLHFKVEDLAASQAVRRCQALVPLLRQKALAREEAKMAEQVRAAAEAAAASQAEDGSEAHQSTSDSVLSDADDPGGIERKFRQLGELPEDAHPDLKLVLGAQRSEIRAHIQRIKEAERNLQVKKCALDYVEGKLSTSSVPEVLNAAITEAQEMRAAIHARQKSEAERKLIEEQRVANVPSEEEVQEQMAETERLEREVERAQEQVKRLQELSAGAQQAAESDISAEPAQDGSAAQQLDTDPKRVSVDLSKIPEEHKRLSQEVATLEEEIAAEDRQIASAESVMRNAEQTLKFLEEAKTLVLEQIAREKPAMIEPLLPALEATKEQDDDAEEMGSSLASSEGEEEETDEDDSQRLNALASEEQWIRTQLAEAEEVGKDGSEKSSENEDDSRALAEPGAQRLALGEQCTLAIQKLTQRLRASKEDPPPDSSNSSSRSNSATPSARTPAPPLVDLSREEAVARLRSMPHAELRALLRLRNDNQRLEKQIEEVRTEMEQLRTRQGDPRALLFGLVKESVEEASAPKGVAPEIMAEVQSQVRELTALRKRWWKERQDDSTTVRRALAAAGLPEDDAVEDEPPSAHEATLFQRIHASMTLP